MNKQSTFVFLPTDKASAIGIIEDNKPHLATEFGFQLFDIKNNHEHEPVYLYILSDEKPSNNDWVYDDFTKDILRYGNGLYKNSYKKIIATTNPELWGIADEGVAPIPQSDIEYIVSLYNKKEAKTDFKNELEKIWEDKNHNNDSFFGAIINLHNKCLQENSDKKFTWEDAEKIWDEAFSNGSEFAVNGKKNTVGFDTYIHSITKQPKSNTVMVEYESIYGESDYVGISSPLIEQDVFKPRLDKDGNIVIVR